MSEYPFPLITISGPPRDRGVQYGNECKELIRQSVDFYRASFKKESNLDWDQALIKSREFVPYIEEYDTEIMEEIRGIAVGAGCTLEEILAINVRSELMFLLTTRGEEQKTSCTVLAAAPEATVGQKTLLAENWDWDFRTQDQCIILKIRQPGRPDIVQLVEAGLIAKAGMNSAGIGLCTNALVCDNWRLGVPFHVILRGILNADSMAAATGAVTKPLRASAGNYLLGHSEGVIINIEAAPDKMNIIYPEFGTITHTNHFLVNNPGINDQIPSLWPYSVTRYARAISLLSAERGRIDVEVIKKILRDHFDKPLSICTHLDNEPPHDSIAQSNASMIFDLNRQQIHIAKGPPCEHPYISIDPDWD